MPQQNTYFKRAIYDFLARNSKYVQPSHEPEITLEIVLEILELLKSSPQERKSSPQEKCNVAPTGNSDHPFYKTTCWKLMWKYILVVDHDDSSTTGHFTSIFFKPIDVGARAKAIGNMFPDNHMTT